MSTYENVEYLFICRDVTCWCTIWFHMSTYCITVSINVSYVNMLLILPMICQHTIHIAQYHFICYHVACITQYDSTYRCMDLWCTELFFMSAIGSYVGIWFIWHNMTPYVDVWTFNPKYCVIHRYIVHIARYDTICWHMASWFNSSWKWH